MEKYLINNNTLMIIPFLNGKSKVIEKYITYIINQSPLDIIDKSCKSYGSSYFGRCDSTYFMTGVKYKCPIIISEVNEIIMFPTSSAKKQECIWINYNAIKNYYSVSTNCVELLLINDAKYQLEISSRIISNQIFKSSRLDSILKSKKH